ncbi:MAG TPA: 3-deoxy-7-phosphoheptulonate synthase [Dictyoglomaceae bacterium]|nr:3-deoxy-7-phosphoheptulonate synthase [Dictyoglomaceae bacterium]HOL38761.1 3-deoxy-7-phosphoheptulonate synthase [Dictyoglomaceae bacterium]HOP94535.1 3-deoxy-7-phosphoheptulonate synthase [Dictyoglomaceae bacterium]HPP15490.1 3-deoxy-7-phosphoheptulonate synthase [Dictyoglomaceae bacterium]HPU43101.1 3-deoxy-7-phosphoheptulonate synthase [Dictyoglomaceae bacterium]
MIIVLKVGATDDDIEKVVKKLKEFNYGANISRGENRTIIGAIGEKRMEEKILIMEQISSLPFVEQVIPILTPYKLVSKEFKPQGTKIYIPPDIEIGGKKITVIAGPCAVESKDQLWEIANFVKGLGAKILRGGAFKPRTSPYSFQGLGIEGLKILHEAKQEFGMPIITEVMDPRDLETVVEYADIIQIGTRNMQNFTLLKEIGKLRKPVLLKRGISATLEEFLFAAEYILVGGNSDVILCERGIRTFSDFSRNTLDLCIVPALKEKTHLPVFVDPSHGTGNFRYVPSMAKAAIAAGADGLIIEVHPHPERALSDGPQSLTFSDFRRLMGELKNIAAAVGKEL